MAILPSVMILVVVWKEKDMILNLSTDVRIPANDVSKRRLFQSFDLIIWKGVEIKKPVSIPQPFELIDQNGIEQFPHHRAPAMILGQASNPDINFFHASIGRLQAILKITIPGDVAKSDGWRKTVGQSNVIVARKSVVSPALQIE